MSAGHNPGPAGATTPRLGRRVARFNRRFTNHLTRPLAARLPGLGIVVHLGRRSGREYRTPVNVFRSQNSYVIALTYGVDSQWVRNVVAAGGCQLITRGRRLRLTAPEIRNDPSCSLVPALARPVLRFMRVTDFMLLTGLDELEDRVDGQAEPDR